MQRRKLRVLQLIDGFGGGGAERKLLELIREMDRSRFETVLCSLGLSSTISSEFESLGVRTVVLKRVGRFDPRPFVELARLIRRERIDVIMTTLFRSDIMAAFVGKFSGAKAVFFWETISSPQWLFWHRLLLYRMAVRFIDRVISVSHATAAFLIHERHVPPGKVTVIQYGIDLRVFHPTDGKKIRGELGLAAGEPVIGMVGRFRPQKGHTYLIQAARILVKRVPNLKIVLVGYGPLQKQIEEEIKCAGLERTFVLTGKREDVSRLLPAFDIFTLPSLFEGLPNVILEAMAVAKPVVATSVDGSKELVVQGRTGFLVSPRDVEALAEALVTLLTQKKTAEAMGQAGRKRVEEVFPLDLQIKLFQQMYETFYHRNAGRTPE